MADRMTTAQRLDAYTEALAALTRRIDDIGARLAERPVLFGTEMPDSAALLAEVRTLLTEVTTLRTEVSALEARINQEDVAAELRALWMVATGGGIYAVHAAHCLSIGAKGLCNCGAMDRARQAAMAAHKTPVES